MATATAMYQEMGMRFWLEKAETARVAATRGRILNRAKPRQTLNRSGRILGAGQRPTRTSLLYARRDRAQTGSAGALSGRRRAPGAGGGRRLSRNRPGPRGAGICPTCTSFPTLGRPVRVVWAEEHTVTTAGPRGAAPARRGGPPLDLGHGSAGGPGAGADDSALGPRPVGSRDPRVRGADEALAPGPLLHP